MNHLRDADPYGRREGCGEEERMQVEMAQDEDTCRLFSPAKSNKWCSVCGAKANGNFFNATVCLPCKSFFIRRTKNGQPIFEKQCQGRCEVSEELRHRCQYCRFQRCLQVGMTRKEKPEVVVAEAGQELCRVCGDLANGIHFGVFTCEGCKKFFRRGLQESRGYVCRAEKGDCSLNPRNRKHCRWCRFRKSLSVGMSRRAIKMGRPRKCAIKSGTDDITSTSQADESVAFPSVPPADTAAVPSTSAAIGPTVPSGNIGHLHSAQYMPLHPTLSTQLLTQKDSPFHSRRRGPRRPFMLKRNPTPWAPPYTKRGKRKAGLGWASKPLPDVRSPAQVNSMSSRVYAHRLPFIGSVSQQENGINVATSRETFVKNEIKNVCEAFPFGISSSVSKPAKSFSVGTGIAVQTNSTPQKCSRRRSKRHTSLL